MHHEFLKKAFEWVGHPTGEGILSSEEHCSTRDVFLARLEKSHSNPLLLAVLGEIGNNAYDHNLGNWRNTPGIYFDLAIKEGTAIVADRGQGVRKTLSRAVPDLQSDKEALETAFTKIISGRSPERRGNGLKFVRQVIQAQNWSLEFYSGTGKAIIQQGKEIEFLEQTEDIRGCLAYISL